MAAPPGDLGRWAEVLSAVKRAESLLVQGEEDAALAARVNAALAQFRADKAAAFEKAHRLEIDRILLAELETARGKSADRDRPALADAAYNDAFRKAGLDIDATDAVEAGQWLAKRSEPVELAGYIDEWTYTRIKAKRPEADWRRLVAVARNIDPDPWRDALRARIAARDSAAAAEFRRLADDDKSLAVQPAPSLILLARQLKEGLNDRERAARVLQRAVLRYPGDFWAHFELGVVGGMPGPPSDWFPYPEEPVRHLTAALAVRPRSLIARSRLAIALFAQDKPGEALAVRREAIRFDPDDAAAHADLGNMLLLNARLDDAIAEHREALRLDPDLANAHYYLGHALECKGELEGSANEYRKAIELEVRPVVYLSLGELLQVQGRFDEAAAAYLQSLRLNPDYVLAHYYLGSTLLEQGKLDDALVETRSASAQTGFCDRLPTARPHPSSSSGLQRLARRVSPGARAREQAACLAPALGAGGRRCRTARGLGRPDTSPHEGRRPAQRQC